MNLPRLQDMCSDVILKAIFTLPNVSRDLSKEESLSPRCFSLIASRVPDFAFTKKLIAEREESFLLERLMRSAVEMFNELARMFTRPIRGDGAGGTVKFNEAFRKKFECNPNLDQVYRSYDDTRYLIQMRGIRSPEAYRSFCLASIEHEDLPLLPEIIYSSSQHENRWGKGGWKEFFSTRDLMDNWCKRSIDQLQSLEKRICTLLKKHSKEFEHYGEDPDNPYEIIEWVLIRMRLGNLVENLESELIKHEATIIDLICRPPSPLFWDRMPQGSIDQLYNLKNRVSHFKDFFGVFFDQYVKLRKLHPQVAIDQLRNLEDWTRGIKELASNFDWETLERIKDSDNLSFLSMRISAWV